jgi:hypothetical protein
MRVHLSNVKGFGEIAELWGIQLYVCNIECVFVCADLEIKKLLDIVSKLSKRKSSGNVQTSCPHSVSKRAICHPEMRTRTPDNPRLQSA